MDLSELTLSGALRGVRSGEFRAVDILDELEQRIVSLDSEVGAYLERDFQGAREMASSADAAKPLAGLPIAIKANINVMGANVSCGSRYLAGAYQAPYDASVVKRLREAGGVPFGLTNMDEFAMGSTTENSALGRTLNPWSAAHVPGGSSGGSAAAVSAGLALAALGSDTGGSIRQPAAYCGVSGLKPTYGRVSRYGLVAFASSLDQVGPLARSVEDLGVLMNVLAGWDRMDSTSLDVGSPDYTDLCVDRVAGLKIGLPKEYFTAGINVEVRSALDAAVAKFSELGAEVVEVSLPHTEYVVATYYIIAPAEASSNLSRFDGIRYGNRVVADGGGVEELNCATREAGFGNEVKRRIILGTYVLSSGYYDAYYTRAQKVRTLIRQDFEGAFGECDLILAPVAPNTAPQLGCYKANPLQAYLADIYTLGANLAGIPGLSLPCGFASDEVADGSRVKLPVGMQLLGPALSEDLLLSAGVAYQQATDWHLQRPEINLGAR